VGIGAIGYLKSDICIGLLEEFVGEGGTRLQATFEGCKSHDLLARATLRTLRLVHGTICEIHDNRWRRLISQQQTIAETNRSADLLLPSGRD